RTRSRARRRALAASALLSIVTALVAVPPRPALAAPGDVTTVAGTGSFFGSGGGDGDGGPPLSADLLPPYRVAIAPGAYYLSQTGFSTDYNRVKVVQNGVIPTVAGGADPPLADGQPATQTFFFQPNAVTTDAAGNLYIADSGHNRVRRVDAATRVVTTI